MKNLHDAIYVLNPSIVTIRDNVAYNSNEQKVVYDLAAAQVKLTELQAQEAQAEQTAKDAKASALAKLAALGLTEAEIKALL
jgi:hypothetical protein